MILQVEKPIKSKKVEKWFVILLEYDKAIYISIQLI